MSAGKIRPSFFHDKAALVAPKLIGAKFLYRGVGGIIVEAEAYDEGDPASHSFAGRHTPRNATMFGAPGHAYIYRSYGVHWCLNFVCEKAGVGSAVLIRALEPRWGLAAMQRRRGTDNPRLLCGGPGRLTQALGLTVVQDGKSLLAPPFELVLPEQPAGIAIGTRIGITRGADMPWRFALKASPFLSRPLA